MKGLRSLLSVMFLPFTSETIATAIWGIAAAVPFGLLPFRWIVGRWPSNQTLFVVCGIESIVFMLLSVSFFVGANIRSYRDNTGARSACQLFGWISLVCGLLMTKAVLS